MHQGTSDRPVRLGVIGGSGLYDLDGLADVRQHELETPFGLPSAPITEGRLGETTLLFLPRHGLGHRFTPSDVPYRANIAALKQLGATQVLAVSAVGSLSAELPPRSIVCPDQIIDRTVAREQTFFDRGIVAHVGLAEPFSQELSRVVQRAAAACGREVGLGATYLCIEGPQFSTKAESRLYRSWGAHVIGMTAMPEARLAREAELAYAMLALVTDYDVWHESEEPVTVELVLSHLHANMTAAREILTQIACRAADLRAVPPVESLRHAIVTHPDVIGPEARTRVASIAADYLG
jgi:5'-methylthioadenosine phosphorylase